MKAAWFEPIYLYLGVNYASEEEMVRAQNFDQQARLDVVRNSGGGCNAEDKALLLELLDRSEAALKAGEVHLVALRKHADELSSVGDAMEAEVSAGWGDESSTAIAWKAAKSGRPS